MPYLGRGVTPMRDIVIFSGSAHPTLAKDICAYLDVPLSLATVTRFSNDCLQVQLNANCREADVFVIQPLVPRVHDHLMELLQMLDAARGASASRTTAVIPYYAYARSDKKDAPRISIAARLTADLLVTAGASRVLTMTLHAPQVHGFFSVPVDHLHALHVLAGYYRDRPLGDTVVVSPDLGRAKDAAHFGRLLDIPVAAGNKRRVTDHKVEIDTIVGDVEGRHVIVLDDEIATGGTILELLERLKERHVRDISVACTHGLFSGPAIARFTAQADVRELVTTDTVPRSREQEMPKLKTLSVAPLLGEAIRRIHHGESVSSLFTSPEWAAEAAHRAAPAR
jgi:ribose-phosphate pyrophosphokinase